MLHSTTKLLSLFLLISTTILTIIRAHPTSSRLSSHQQDARFLTSTSSFLPTLRSESWFGGLSSLFPSASNDDEEALSSTEPQVVSAEDNTSTSSTDDESTDDESTTIGRDPGLVEEEEEKATSEIDSTTTPEPETETVVTTPEPSSTPISVFGITPKAGSTEDTAEAGDPFTTDVGEKKKKRGKGGMFAVGSVGIIAGVAGVVVIVGGSWWWIRRRRSEGFEGMTRTEPGLYRAENYRDSGRRNFELGEESA